jgi:hypothetical protein
VIVRRDTQTEDKEDTDRQQGDLISLLLFIEGKENKLKTLF